MTPETTKSGPMSMVQLALGGDWQGWPQAAASLR